MLSMFPTPYPDELFYSICARYHFKSRNASYKQTMDDLFGSKTATAIVDMPNRLNALFENIPTGTALTPDYFIKSSTLYPVYQPFLSKEKAESISQSMKGNHGNHKGMITSGYIKPPKYFRFCPKCIEEDEKCWGEAYWHRVHQISGVELCPIHFCWLGESQLRLESRRSAQAFYSVCSVENQQVSKSEFEYYDHFKVIALDFNWLLNNEVPTLGFQQLNAKYLHLLNKKGYITVLGKVRQELLVESMIDFYGSEFLKKLNSEKVNRWLKDLFKNNDSMTHPLRHILLMRFLGTSTEKFFSPNDTLERHNTKPFGEGPWLCLNPVCVNYHKPVITHCEIKRNNNNSMPSGKFSCECGFVYSRSGPDKHELDLVKIGRIISYGEIWESELLRLYNSKEKTIKEIAVHLSASPSTIHKHVKRLKSNEPAKGNDICIQKETDFIKKRNIYRSIWLKTIQANKDIKKTDLQRKQTAIYSWLYRNDREWFELNSPKLKKGYFKGHHVDWEARDNEIEKLVINAAIEICEINGKPVRITKKGIGKHIGKLHYLQKEEYSDRLPKTREILQSVLETHEQFQIRKIKWAAMQLKKNGQEVVRWRILHLTGLGVNISQAVSNAIDYEVGFFCGNG
jgi:hypothetical protein